jgi:hypothetical protein
MPCSAPSSSAIGVASPVAVATLNTWLVRPPARTASRRRPRAQGAQVLEPAEPSRSSDASRSWRLGSRHQSGSRSLRGRNVGGPSVRRHGDAGRTFGRGARDGGDLGGGVRGQATAAAAAPGADRRAGARGEVGTVTDTAAS